MTIRAPKAAPPDRLPLLVIMGLGAANLPIAALSVAVLVYLPPYFAGHLRVPMALVGGIWMTIRLIDIPVDVLLALAMDRTRTRVGRYRPWLLAGAPVVMLGLYQLYMAPIGFGGGYLLSWLLVLYLGWSMTSLAQAAWGATLAADYHDRSRLFGVVTAMGVIGTLAVLLLPIVGRGLGWNDAFSVRSMGWAMIVAMPIGAAVAAIRTPERPTPSSARRPFPLRDYLAIMRKPDLLRLLVAQVGLTLGPGWMSALYLFFAADAKGFSIQSASILLALYIAAGFPGALAVAALVPDAARDLLQPDFPARLVRRGGDCGAVAGCIGMRGRRHDWRFAGERQAIDLVDGGVELDGQARQIRRWRGVQLVHVLRDGLADRHDLRTGRGRCKPGIGALQREERELDVAGQLQLLARARQDLFDLRHASSRRGCWRDPDIAAAAPGFARVASESLPWNWMICVSMRLDRAGCLVGLGAQIGRLGMRVACEQALRELRVALVELCGSARNHPHPPQSP